MAKLRAPLFSFEARGKLADSLVYFPWKGIAAVRQYVIPANPKSDAQVLQRGYLEDAVNEWHDTEKLDAEDKTAWNRAAGILARTMSGFNAFVKTWIDVAKGLDAPYMPFDCSLADDGDGTFSSAGSTDNPINSFAMIWGFSPTALVNLESLAGGPPDWTATPATDVSGRRVYAKFQNWIGASFRGESGLYQVDVATP